MLDGRSIPYHWEIYDEVRDALYINEFCQLTLPRCAPPEAYHKSSLFVRLERLVLAVDLAVEEGRALSPMGMGKREELARHKVPGMRRYNVENRASVSVYPRPFRAASWAGAMFIASVFLR